MRNADQDAFASDTDHGLTKRELFAAMAMQGYATTFAHPESCSLTKNLFANVAATAIGLADALLAELEKTK